MEREYLKAIDIWVYIVLAVLGWIFQLYKKFQEKAQNERDGKFLDEQEKPVPANPKADFEEVLKRFSGDLKRELRTEPVVIEEPKKHKTNTEATINSIAELKAKYGVRTVAEEKPKEVPVKRFEEYVIKKEKKNTFADLLDDKENFKKAFILSEILKKKEY